LIKLEPRIAVMPGLQPKVPALAGDQPEEFGG